MVCLLATYMHGTASARRPFLDGSRQSSARLELCQGAKPGAAGHRARAPVLGRQLLAQEQDGGQRVEAGQLGQDEHQRGAAARARHREEQLRARGAQELGGEQNSCVSMRADSQRICAHLHRAMHQLGTKVCRDPVQIPKETCMLADFNSLIITLGPDITHRTQAPDTRPAA
jgi:hypothetical protein